MEKIFMFGAGGICKKKIPIIATYVSVEGIIDTNRNKWGSSIYGIPIISFEEYLEKYREHEIIIATNDKNYQEIAEFLIRNNIENFSFYKEKFNLEEMDKRERLVSYSLPMDMEDVILYHVFKETDDIFYIDVGSNDPIVISVTKLLYDTKNARGINIEPQQRFIDFFNQERERDINICTGVGEKEGVTDFYIQGFSYLIGAQSTVLSESVNEMYYKSKTSIPITTLKKICEEHIDKNQNISFLKIDVEGYEKNVLLGMDFQNYRPQVIVMESYYPTPEIPRYDVWEYIIKENHYHFVYEYGMDRYYVADECSELDKRFIPMLELMKRYRVFTVNFDS